MLKDVCQGRSYPCSSYITNSQLIEREGCDDEGIRDHVSELLMQLEGEGLPPIQDDDEAEAEGDDADEAEWLDEEDDDIEMK